MLPQHLWCRHAIPMLLTNLLCHVGSILLVASWSMRTRRPPGRHLAIHNTWVINHGGVSAPVDISPRSRGKVRVFHRYAWHPFYLTALGGVSLPCTASLGGPIGLHVSIPLCGVNLVSIRRPRLDIGFSPASMHTHNRQDTTALRGRACIPASLCPLPLI